LAGVFSGLLRQATNSAFRDDFATGVWAKFGALAIRGSGVSVMVILNWQLALNQ
jgi:hypothetical protein